MRNMGSPIAGLDDARPSAEIGSVELEPFKDFEFDLSTNRLRCAGYSVDEVSELLRLYREHLSALAEFAMIQNDAMREAARDL